MIGHTDILIEGKRWGLGLGRNHQSKQNPVSDSNDQSFDDAFSLSLEDKREEMERSSNEYRNIILMLSEEVRQSEMPIINSETKSNVRFRLKVSRAN